MPDALPPSDAYLSPPVQRAARLLRRIAEGDAAANMSRTARALGISRTTLLRCCARWRPSASSSRAARRARAGASAPR
jgi:transposase-like protein